MPKLRVLAFGVSMDGFGAGPRQSLENPLGVNGPDLMEWFFPTTVFRRMNGRIHEALKRAREAAGDRDVRIGGGVSTVRQYLEAGLIDELQLAVRPILLGEGEGSCFTGSTCGHSAITSCGTSPASGRCT